MNELNISNKALLDELGKRFKEGKIRLIGRQLIADPEKGSNLSPSYTLKVDVGYMVNAVIQDLKNEIKFVRIDKERFEKWADEYKKQLEQLKTGNQSS